MSLLLRNSHPLGRTRTPSYVNLILTPFLLRTYELPPKQATERSLLCWQLGPNYRSGISEAKRGEDGLHFPFRLKDLFLPFSDLSLSVLRWFSWWVNQTLLLCLQFSRSDLFEIVYLSRSDLFYFLFLLQMRIKFPRVSIFYSSFGFNR